MADSILIVDDDEHIRAVAREAWLSHDYQVIDTGDPQEAIRIAKAHRIDLLLTDVVMPLMKGTQLAVRIQEIAPSTKVLLMSGYQTADVSGSGQPFLAKPFSIDDLARRVRETLARPSPFARRAEAPPVAL
jgi:DNA-binding NtrC family response regulator